jgi:hypothetical protein
MGRAVRNLSTVVWRISYDALIGFRGAYAPLVSEKRHSCLRLLKNKAFKEERRTKNAVYAIGECTTLESNKSLTGFTWWDPQSGGERRAGGRSYTDA